MPILYEGLLIVKLAAYQFFYPFIEVPALGTKHINSNTFSYIFTGSRFVVIIMCLFVSLYRLDDAFAWSRFRAVVDEFGISGFLQVFFQLSAAFHTTGIMFRQMLNTAEQKWPMLSQLESRRPSGLRKSTLCYTEGQVYDQLIR